MRQKKATRAFVVFVIVAAAAILAFATIRSLDLGSPGEENGHNHSEHVE